MPATATAVLPRARTRWRSVLLLAATIAGACTRPSTAAGEKPKPAAAPKPAVSIISEAQLRQALEAKKGRVVVLHFWATWCVPCLEEIPLITQLTRDAQRRGVELFSVSLDDPTEPAAAKVAEVLVAHKADPKGTIVKVSDPDLFLASIDPRWDGTIPAFFAYDREGRLRRAFLGEMNAAHFDKLIADLAGPQAGGKK